MVKILGLALYGSTAASHRVRLAQYRRGLLAEGIDLQIHSLLGNRYLQYRFNGYHLPIGAVIRSYVERLFHLLDKQRFDAALVHCELFPLAPSWLESLVLRIPYIYDFDDAFYLRYQRGKFASLRFLLGHKFEKVIRSAAAVTAGNSYLADFASTLNPNVVVLPSVVDTNRYLPATKKNDLTFTVGWIGSPSSAFFLERLIAPLSALGKDGPLKLVVIGGRAPQIPNVEVQQIPWVESNEVDWINTFDVGVMPLPNDEWARGKCAYKLVQYMACGVPVVASRVGANIDLVTTQCGFLVESDEQWVDALRELRGRPSLRQRMGVASRKRVVDFYSLKSSLPVLVKTIRKVVEEK